MVDNTFLSFSFIQGVFAFFAPCAVSLLPGYLSTFVAKSAVDSHPLTMLKKAVWLALFTILGILFVYGIATVFILLFREIVKASIVYIAMGLGIIVIIIGLFMFFEKPLSFSFKLPYLKSKNQLIEAFVFGIAYGIGVLGCLLPFFLVVAITAIQAPTIFAGGSYIVAYIFGMSVLMLLFYILAQFSRSFLQRSLQTILPYVNKIGGIFVIAAGIYIIWYQSALIV